MGNEYAKLAPKFWSAALAEDALFPPSGDDGYDGKETYRGTIDLKEMWSATPRADINSLLEEVKERQKTDKQDYIVFQFFVPEEEMGNLLDTVCQAQQGDTGSPLFMETGKFFGRRKKT